MDLAELLKLKYPNAIIGEDIKLRDDGNGPYITHWGLEEVEPTIVELNTWLADTSLSAQVVLKTTIAKLDAYVNKKATERGYNDAVSLASYKDSTITKWAAESAVFIEWRDQVWGVTIQTQQDVLDGIKPLPSFEDFIAALPPLVWPE